MDDFSVNSLTESKNEWCARLLTILTPSVIQGLKSIFDEALKLCQDNKENDKYLMTFQNFLTRVPKWNQTIIDTEQKRIAETSGCTYLEELITCVHVIQLKALTCVRVGSKQKKIDINVPSTNDFIHKIYIHVARKIYTNIYLFERNIAPLQIQKNNREIELIVKECILNSIRDSIPVDTILRAYMDETEEQDVEVKEVEEVIPEAPKVTTTAKVSSAEAVSAAAVSAVSTEAVSTEAVSTEAVSTEAVSAEAVSAEAVSAAEYKQTTSFSKPPLASNNAISFSNDDRAIDSQGITSIINSPKDVKTLEELSQARSLAQIIDDDDGDEEGERLSIGENIKLDITDINDLNKASIISLQPPVLDFEILH